jgi:hypothetical protein
MRRGGLKNPPLQIKEFMKNKIIASSLLYLFFLFTAGCSAQSKISKFNDLIGRWLRPDGGYVLAINGVDAQGNLDAGYFNPNNINVAKAQASMEEDQIKIYIEMQDIGYPGSNYTLTYDKENDRLVGVYYHAILKQKFDIYFIRQKS